MKDISFTFGIITDGTPNNLKNLSRVVHSIRTMHIPEYEILIVGPEKNIRVMPHFGKDEDRLNIIDFNESIKPAWITKKKNLITINALYENIVYSHDYITYEPGWYDGWKLFGEDYKACMNKIQNLDGTRFRDWVIFPWYCISCRLSQETTNLWSYANIHNNESMIPYNESNLTRWQYFSGSYWVAKKSVMLEMPLDENLVWGQGEDCQWSLIFSEKYKFSMNANSTVKFLKQKQDAFSMIRPGCLQKVIEFRNKICS